MWYRVLLYCSVPHYTVSHYAVLYNAVLYSIVRCAGHYCVVLCYVSLNIRDMHCNALYCAVVKCTVSYYIVLSFTVLYNVLVHYAVQSFASLYCTVFPIVF